jgi:hypothetical protein
VPKEAAQQERELERQRVAAEVRDEERRQRLMRQQAVEEQRRADAVVRDLDRRMAAAERERRRRAAEADRRQRQATEETRASEAQKRTQEITTPSGAGPAPSGPCTRTEQIQSAVAKCVQWPQRPGDG